MFQFQIGAIRSQKGIIIMAIITILFQFQIGAIRSSKCSIIFACFLCFNSRLVRLEVSLPEHHKLDGEKFQFQIGAIRRVLKQALQCANLCFNSRLVRLEGITNNEQPQLLPFQFQIGAIRRQEVL